MNKVYILIKSFPYDDSDVHSVYADQKSAEAAKQVLEKEPGAHGVDYYVEEHEVK